MKKDMIGKASIAAVILLAPGGFVFGLALLARHYRARCGETEPSGVVVRQA